MQSRGGLRGVSARTRLTAPTGPAPPPDFSDNSTAKTLRG
jgi:hypothetical protein